MNTGQSNKFFFLENLLKSSVSVSGRPHKARNGDKVAFAEINSAILVELNGEGVTSQTESWMEE
mgnify:CR=1 FL=1